MTPEMTALTLAALLQCVQFLLMAVPTNLQVGREKTLSPRDGLDIEAEVSITTARLIRAYNNHFESLVLFAIAVIVVTLSDQSSATTRTCAWVYLAARILYIPAYYFGLVPWRSLIWSVGFLATTLMLVSALI